MPTSGFIPWIKIGVQGNLMKGKWRISATRVPRRPRRSARGPDSAWAGAAGRLVEGEQVLVEMAADLRLDQADAGDLVLRVDHRPLPEVQRLLREHQREQPLAGARGAHHRDLDLVRQPL